MKSIREISADYKEAQISSVPSFAFFLDPWEWFMLDLHWRQNHHGYPQESD